MFLHKVLGCHVVPPQTQTSNATLSKMTDVWNVVGLGIASVVAIVAFARASARPGHYDGAGYGMLPSTHRRYALAAAALALAFIAALVWPAIPTVPLLGVAVLVALFYGTSFLRGAEGDG